MRIVLRREVREPDAAGGYLVTCEEMPPMIAYGETLEEARAQAAEELTGWMHPCDSIRDSTPSLLR